MSHRVAIAVQPTLLGHTLSRVMERSDFEIVVLQPSDTMTGNYDIVVINDDRDEPLDVSVVIRLPLDEETEEGSVTTSSGERPERLGDLPSVLDVLDRYFGPAPLD